MTGGRHEQAPRDGRLRQPDDSERRFRERMAREDRRRERARKRWIATGLVIGSFAATLSVAMLARAVGSSAAPKQAQPASEVAKKPVTPATPAVQTRAADVEPTPALSPAKPPVTKPKPETRKTGSRDTATKPLPKKETPKPPAKVATVQRVRIDIGASGYEPSTLRVKAGSPVVITVGKGEGCAAGFLMPQLGVEKDNSTSSITFRLGPLKRGTYRFTCGMEMVEGKLIVL